MSTQSVKSLTSSGDVPGEVLDGNPLIIVEDVATQPIDVSSLIAQRGESS